MCFIVYGKRNQCLNMFKTVNKAIDLFENFLEIADNLERKKYVNLKYWI